MSGPVGFPDSHLTSLVVLHKCANTTKVGVFKFSPSRRGGETRPHTAKPRDQRMSFFGRELARSNLPPPAGFRIAASVLHSSIAEWGSGCECCFERVHADLVRVVPSESYVANSRSLSMSPVHARVSSWAERMECESQARTSVPHQTRACHFGAPHGARRNVTGVGV